MNEAKKRWTSWKRWLKFYHYLYLARHKGIEDVEAVAISKWYIGFFIWLSSIRVGFKRPVINIWSKYIE